MSDISRHNPYLPRPLAPISSPKPQRLYQPQENVANFDQILHQELTDNKPLIFSQHAKQRLAARDIELDAQEIAQLQDAVQKARSKGAKESLILSNKAAFIVSVRNNTVVTAVDRDGLKDNVFTNIDSAVVL